MKPLLFISDLHLSAERPELTGLFQQLLDDWDGRCDGLYILGDLFEAWLGDDLVLPEYQGVIEALSTFTARGNRVYLMHGNRDFLIGEAMAAQMGVELLEDPQTIDLFGTPTLLMHGDLLCTDDSEYQKMRAMLRNHQWQAQMLAKSAEERIAFARSLRDKSKEATQGKQETIMDVNQDTVVQIMEEYLVGCLIHGHTHRPGRHQLTLQSGEAERIVLADWNEQGEVLVCTPEGCEARKIG